MIRAQVVAVRTFSQRLVSWTMVSNGGRPVAPFDSLPGVVFRQSQGVQLLKSTGRVASRRTWRVAPPNTSSRSRVWP